MLGRLIRTAVWTAIIVAASAPAQTPPASPAQPDAALPVAPAPSSPVEAYYAARPSSIWLVGSDTRAAAEKLPALFRAAIVDGFDGPALAASVEAALAGGQPSDDRIISAAWVRFVQALSSPVAGINYGDPALKLKAPSAAAILSQAAAAPSLAAHVDGVAAVNPFYAVLHDAAVKENATGDPRVRATLDRLRLIPATGHAIVVDVASAQLWMVEDGRIIDSMKVIVGKTTSPTPLLAGTIHYVTFNPYWHILDEVAQRKVAPIVLKRGVKYLKAARYETVSDWTTSDAVDPAAVDWKAVADGSRQVFIRQLPGAHNMMGAMKFSFENEFDIFLHDTPHRELFAKAKRTLSLGCIRLEHADRLAQWLLGRDPAAPTNTPELNVQLDKGVPVYITYLTANVRDAQLTFADDIYALDSPAVAVASSEPPAQAAEDLAKVDPASSSASAKP